MNYLKRMIALLMAGMLLFSAFPLHAPAAEAASGDGLCEHHPRHTQSCGYAEGSQGAPCSHEHADECYPPVEQCLHIHTEACSPTPQDGAAPSGCGHVCSEETGCVTKALACRHQHDAGCGYSPAAEAAPCAFVCSACQPQEGNPVDWPEAPELPEGPPELEDGETAGEIYGQPAQKLSAQSLALLQSQSQNASAAADESSQNLAEHFTRITFLYINGSPYTGGDLTVMEGDNFSYVSSWSPTGEIELREGSWFEYQLFQVPGLNLHQKIEAPLVINGIKVGDYTLTYDQTFGAMTYRAVFNRYIQFFDPEKIIAQYQGSGKFSKTGSGNISVEPSGNGTLTIQPRPPLPEPPPSPGGGTGWAPSKGPGFNNNLFPFGKGVKWHSASDPSVRPQIEWRVVFLEQLQKTQQAFLNGETSQEASDGNLIITETLDANQRFFYPEYEAWRGRYQNDAPFFLELPVVVPGTGNILNGVQNTGGSEYDGPGEIYPYITGNSFKKIDGSQATTAEEIKKVEQAVRDTPLSWTVTTHPDTRKQTLLINVGKLGGTNPTEGITWSMANEQKWPHGELDKLIKNCDDKILAIQNGSDSPITLLRNRQNNLLNQLKRAAAKQDDPQAAEQKIEEWRKDFQRWSSDNRVGPLYQLEDQKGNLLLPLPSQDLVEGFATWPVDAKTTIETTGAYKDYLKSLENLQKDQKTYLANRTEYGNDWAAAKERYQQTKEFYQNGRIFGFVLKLRTESINTSASSYQNSVEFSMGKSDWRAEDTSEVQFSSGIIGDFSLGDVVVQKADAFYDTDEDDIPDIQHITDQKAGLAGAQFQVYFDDDGGEPNLNEENLGHFLNKDASEKGNTYRLGHIGEGEGEHVPIPGEVTKLEVNLDGRLVLGKIPPLADPWLVEYKAPDGYYLDKTPIPLDSKDDEVTYKLLGNHSRSVLLEKIDSFSKNPVEGAEFQLFKLIDGKEEPVTGFTEKSLNGHQSIWKTADGNGTAKLLTNADGRLCIHGLDAGQYVLRETQPAPGYKEPDSTVEYTFTLEEELPEAGNNYDEDYHYLLTLKNPLENEPDVATLTLNKEGENVDPLEKAAFALFRFTGTEAQWQENPDNEDHWEAVPLNAADGKYFKTTNKTKEITLTGGGNWDQKTLNAALTDKDGQLTITDIPVGHYSIAEVEAPKDFIRDLRSFYFTVDEETAGTNKSPRLYAGLDDPTGLPDNTLVNHKIKAQLALVKYDKVGEEPSIAGDKVNGGHRYTDKILDDNSGHTGLEGAVYKLFMHRGGHPDQTNYDPAQIAETKMIANNPRYDPCLAVGSTGEDGILRLSDMENELDPSQSVADGVEPENYYLIEVEAPDGYLLDQSPIRFRIDEKVFPNNPDEPAGLVMTASNQKTDYGLKLQKVDAATVGDNSAPTGLPGAEFSVEQDGTTLYFTGADGVYQKAPERTLGAEDKVVTGEDGTLTITGLDGDTKYTFTETKAPQGFSNKTEDGALVAVTLATPGSIQEGELTTDGVLYPKTIEQVENQRLKGRMTLHKEDAETAEALADAEFTLYRTEVTVIPNDDPDYDPAHPDATRSEEIEVATGITNENGDLTFEDLEWDQFYYVIETKAPDGYLLDETKRQFSIDENSFDADGNPIPILFPLVTNSKGVLGEAVLYKVDAEDHSKRLEDAHFYLMKKVWEDADGEEIWTGYGKELYKTDQKGEIHFLLPPGDYKLIEMKAPDGYLLPEDLNFEPRFTIEEPEDGSQPEPVVITLENRKGGAGFSLKKNLGTWDLRVPGVTFQFYQGMGLYTPLYFVLREDGVYEYTENPNVQGATLELTTNDEGELRVSFPKEFADAYDKLETENWIYYEEVNAPENVVITPGKQLVSDLKGDLWTNDSVINALDPEVQKSLSITVQKKDGEDGRGLPGAEFELFTVLNLGGGEQHEISVAKGTTDQNGALIFSNSGGNEKLLEPGATYYLRETKAPDGYVLDETVHRIPLDETCFDEDFNFIPVERTLYNYKLTGSVRLVKEDETDSSKKLAGAEFELLHKAADAEPLDDQWEHYGQPRYITDANGELLIEDLPYGTYQLVERSAPLGYLLGAPAWTGTFQIEKEGDKIDLGVVTNKPDGKPARDVTVQKVAAHNPSLRLPGAEFKLYEAQDDGNYYLRQHKTYVTDANGSFTIGHLPVGNYALKEITAPAGYKLPEQPMTYFSVKEQDQEVLLQIQNVRSGGGGEGSSSFSVTVQKLWKDHPSVQRPDSVLVQLYQNGVAYGKPVTLNEDNGWRYRWNDLDEEDRWEVDEVQVPEGYQKSVTHDGNAWTITNTAEGDVPPDPGEPEDPDNPGGPDNPDDPNNPDDPHNPNDPDNPDKPGDSGNPNRPNRPTDSVPQTDDPTRLDLWMILAALSAAGFLLVWFAPVSRRKKRKPKHFIH